MRSVRAAQSAAITQRIRFDRRARSHQVGFDHISHNIETDGVLGKGRRISREAISIIRLLSSTLAIARHCLSMAPIRLVEYLSLLISLSK
jgi:hypothetical protein